MKYGLKKRALAVSAAVVMAFSSVSAFADGFSDVASDNYAYAAILSVTSKGIMSGDADGKFNPDKYIDKFDTSSMFAKLLGYKESGATAEEVAYYDKAYEDNKSLISKYSSKFTKWNSTADRKVAFLLAKGFYKEDDLEQFVILSSEGKEQLRALSREEMALFLVRYADKVTSANNFSPTSKYADDASIAENKKSSVYYMTDLGVFKPDADNKFKPKGAVTRADFCYLLDLAMNRTGKVYTPDAAIQSTQTSVSSQTPQSSASSATTQPSSSAASTNSGNSGTGNSILEKFYDSMNIMQVNENGVHRLYKVLSSAVIKVNGSPTAVADVPMGVAATVTLVNGEITGIDVQSAQTTAEIPTPTPVQTQESTQSTVQTPVQAGTSTVQQQSNVVQPSSVPSVQSVSDHVPTDTEFTVIKGKVVSAAADAVTVEYKMYVSGGTSEPVTRTYPVAAGCNITRNGSSQLSAGALVKGDEAEISIYAAKAYKIVAVDSEKGADTSGSKKEISSNSGKIDGYVTAIEIGKNRSTITIAAENNGEDGETYTVDTDTVPLYVLKIGDRIRANAEDGELKSFSIKKSVDTETYVGYITTKKSDYIVVEYYDGEGLNTGKFYYKKNMTTVISGTSGEEEEFSDLEKNMRVYVVPGDDKYIDTVVVIENI